MKYKVLDITNWLDESKTRYVTILITEDDFKTFPADKSNPDYVQFLIDAKLTDAAVKKLTPGAWYDFPA